MDNTSTTSYWVAAAIILVLLVVGVALWYSATTTTPGVPNTGTTQTSGTDYDQSSPSGSLDSSGAVSTTSSGTGTSD